MVIRYEGPKAARECGKSGTKSALMERLGRRVGLIPDGRFSEATGDGVAIGTGSVRGRHPGAGQKMIRYDSIAQAFAEAHVEDDESSRRRAQWKQPKPRYTTGVLAKFAKMASTASKGAITDEKLFD